MFKGKHEIFECILCKTIYSVQIPGITFNWLEGNPKVCERCWAANFGINADWKKEVKEHFKFEEETKSV